MSCRMVRVNCVAVRGQDWDDLQLQLLLDENDRVIPNISMLGIFGTWERKRETNWPFLYQLLPSGKEEIDFGTFPEYFDDEFDVFTPVRFGSSNLGTKNIRPDELITIWAHGDEIYLRVKSVSTLIEGELGSKFAT